MEVCMKCQQSGINYLKDSTMHCIAMYNIFQWSQATRHLGGQFSRGCLWRFSFHVLCIGECCVAPWPLPGDESDHYWLASVRPELLQYPVNTHNTSPDPSLLSWELSPLPLLWAAHSCPPLLSSLLLSTRRHRVRVNTHPVKCVSAV